jgi:hypothetical protein
MKDYFYSDPEGVAEHGSDGDFSAVEVNNLLQPVTEPTNNNTKDLLR